MATNLRKFVNPKFLKTCDLALMRRLMARYPADKLSIHPAAFDGEADAVREVLRKFFEGPEGGYPPALTTELHRIASLGTRHGLRLLLERAKAANIVIGPRPGSKDADKADPKYVALLCFLDHRPIFDKASDLLALETTVALAELRGEAGNAPPTLNDKTRAAFEKAVRKLLLSEMMGNYCRIGWYADGDEVRIVAVHGREVTTEWVVEGKTEKVISFQPLGTTVLSYDPVEGRLKVGGLPRALRPAMADIFAGTMLGRPAFFRGDDASRLYTLDPVEAAGFSFRFDHQFDPGIVSVKIVEAQAERLTAPKPGQRQASLWSVMVKDRANALERMGRVTAVSFGENAYRLAHIRVRVEFGAKTGRNPQVTVKFAPPDVAGFKREAFEGRILTLFRRNGLCLDRKPDEIAVAAE